VNIGKYVTIGSYPFSFKDGVHIQAKYNVILGEDILINPHVNIAAGIERDTTIGDRTKIDSFVQIAHDVVIGKDCIICPGAQILGHVTIGNNSRINTNAVIHQRVTIGNNYTIGANSYVRHDVPDGMTVYGTPAEEKP
jgi:UDP-3-O-[3-hydroxymyristoyl] glucosamine N-acyltransferase